MIIINKYDRRRVSFLKWIFKDVYFVLYFVYSYVANGGKVRTVLFYPDYPSKRAVLYKVFRNAHFNITNNPRFIHEIGIFWTEKTTRTNDAITHVLNNKQHLVNFDFIDSSKVAVDKAFSEVFSRSTFIDPLSHQGIGVKKSDINAAHDGIIINCPIPEVEPGSVYQILIDNVVDNDFVEDIRIPVVKYKIPLVYLKYKHLQKRFGTFKQSLARIKQHKVVENPLEVLSQDELNKILEFCRVLNIEYGELDVLRDRKSGEIYIIDANNTPHGPTGFSLSHKRKALSLLQDEILRPAN
jgi:hypothetical protein